MLVRLKLRFWIGSELLRFGNAASKGAFRFFTVGPTCLHSPVPSNILTKYTQLCGHVQYACSHVCKRVPFMDCCLLCSRSKPLLQHQQTTNNPLVRASCPLRSIFSTEPTVLSYCLHWEGLCFTPAESSAHTDVSSTPGRAVAGRCFRIRHIDDKHGWLQKWSQNIQVTSAAILRWWCNFWADIEVPRLNLANGFSLHQVTISKENWSVEHPKRKKSLLSFHFDPYLLTWGGASDGDMLALCLGRPCVSSETRSLDKVTFCQWTLYVSGCKVRMLIHLFRRNTKKSS